jgi:thioredoxin 1
MLNRRSTLSLLALSSLAGLTPASAAIGAKFSAEAFEAAQKAGKSVLIFVHAPWCPTCRVQEPILGKLLAEPKYAKIVLFTVDFDSEKAVLRRFNTSKQSTLIGFRGATETRRSSGDTEAMSIEDLIETTL